MAVLPPALLVFYFRGGKHCSSCRQCQNQSLPSNDEKMYNDFIFESTGICRTVNNQDFQNDITLKHSIYCVWLILRVVECFPVVKRNVLSGKIKHTFVAINGNEGVDSIFMYQRSVDIVCLF